MDHFHKWSPFMMLKTGVEMPDWKPSLSSAKRGLFVELLADKPENNVGLAFLFTQCLQPQHSFESETIFFLHSLILHAGYSAYIFVPFRLERISIKRLCWVETNPGWSAFRQRQVTRNRNLGLNICDELLQWGGGKWLEEWTPKIPLN